VAIDYNKEFQLKEVIATTFTSWLNKNEVVSALATLWIVLGLAESHPFGKSPDYFEILKPRPEGRGNIILHSA
jgi:hypothetical protein